MTQMNLSTIALLWHGSKEKMVNNWASLKVALANDRKGWLICLAVLLITVVRSGITYSFGEITVTLQKSYHRSMAEENWIGTLSFCISLSMAPVSVAFIRCLRYRGYRWGGIIGTVVLAVSCLASSLVPKVEWMFLTHSLLYGAGSSLLYMASSLVIGEYFDKDHKYHVLATSILLCGYPVGSLLFNPINAWLSLRYGWRVTFRCAGGLILMTGLVCCWTFTSKETASMERLEEDDEEQSAVTQTQEQQEAEHREIQQRLEKERYEEEQFRSQEPFSVAGKVRQAAGYLKGLPAKCCQVSDIKARPEILLWYLGNCITYLGFYMPFLNLAFYMKLKGISTTRSSFSLTLLSLAECITYLIASFYGDYLKGRLVYINVVASGALAFICIIWPFVDVGYSVICLIAIAMGGFLGLTIVYTYAASGEVTELPIDIAWSFTNMWSGLGILFGPSFSGAIYDFRKSYDDVFYVVGVLYLIDAAFFAGVPFLKNRRLARERMESNEFTGIVGEQHKQTFRITKRSISKSSLVDGEPGGAVSEYGSTAATDYPNHHSANQMPNNNRNMEKDLYPDSSSQE